MSFEIYEASPQSKAKIKSYTDNVGLSTNSHHRSKYPFGRLKIGQCFIVSIFEHKEQSLRVCAYTAAKKLNKKFCVLKHVEHNCVECARI